MVFEQIDGRGEILGGQRVADGRGAGCVAGFACVTGLGVPEAGAAVQLGEIAWVARYEDSCSRSANR